MFTVSVLQFWQCCEEGPLRSKTSLAMVSAVTLVAMAGTT